MRACTTTWAWISAGTGEPDARVGKLQSQRGAQGATPATSRAVATITGVDDNERSSSAASSPPACRVVGEATRYIASRWRPLLKPASPWRPPRLASQTRQVRVY